MWITTVVFSGVEFRSWTTRDTTWRARTGARVGGRANRVSTAPTTVAAGVTYQYAVEAVDPDQDTLTYSLTGPAPAGMSINAQTGLISWPTRPDDVGVSHPVTRWMGASR